MTIVMVITALNWERENVIRWENEPLYDEAESTSSYAEYADYFKPLLIDWFERHPLKHNVKIQFMNEFVEYGDGIECLMYKLYLNWEEYGIFYVNPDSGYVVMDSIRDNNGNWLSVGVSIEEWYLYYWGGVDG